MGIEDVLRIAATDPARCALFADMDGTLSHIIDDPASVEPVAGAGELLAELASCYGAVAVISGRPVAFLDRFFAPPIELSGLYGLEHRTGDRVLIDSAALEWLPTMSECADDARSKFGIEAVEDKRYSMTVHYRTADAECAARILEWSAQVAERTGLDARPAKMSVELHPPTERSKGDVVEDLLLGIRAAVYFGDDVGDLPAFARLGQAADSGELEAVATVLVQSDETPAELSELATDLVDTPLEAVEMLERFTF